jgi:hypothetical protein
MRPPLPLEQPAGAKWEVRIVAIIGRFALSVRRLGQTYANAVVEKHLGVPATTRNWNTIEAIREVLEKQFSLNRASSKKHFQLSSLLPNEAPHRRHTSTHFKP